jgi:XTP/dITP diphosphohydrolase
MRQILLATGNRHKTKEFAQLLGGEFVVCDLNSHPQIQPGLENGATFLENAVAKALAVSRQFDGLVLADDSGLEVDALGGAPGVFSARYAGDKASDSRNVEKLLRELGREADRRARFRCVLALARNGELLASCEGTVEGNLGFGPAGRNGFGYDPVFIPHGFDRTFAELPGRLKNEISHRARAVAALHEPLANTR